NLSHRLQHQARLVLTVGAGAQHPKLVIGKERTLRRRRFSGWLGGGEASPTTRRCRYSHPGEFTTSPASRSIRSASQCDTSEVKVPADVEPVRGGMGHRRPGHSRDGAAASLLTSYGNDLMFRDSL